VESPPRAAHQRQDHRQGGRSGVKLAGLTPDEARVPEFNLKRKYKSPHRTLRNDKLDTNLQRAMA
jgi:hypothetical protein